MAGLPGPVRRLRTLPVRVCPETASPLGLCSRHEARHTSGKADREAWPSRGQWGNRYEGRGLPVPVAYADREPLPPLVRATAAVLRPGQVNLRGLGPLLRAEIQWGMCWHARGQHGGSWVQPLVNYGPRHPALPHRPGPMIPACARRGQGGPASPAPSPTVCPTSRPETRGAGYILTEHFGRRLTDRSSHFDLDRISQRWLRDLVWDHFADVLRSPSCPRSGSTFDDTRRAGLELSAFLEPALPAAAMTPGC